MSELPVIEPVRGRADLEAVVEVVRRVWQRDVPSVDDLEHWLHTEPDALLLLARLGDEVAGSGWAAPTPEAGCAFSMVRVVPELQGRGVGSALYVALSEHARRLGREVLQGRVREEDADSRRVLERRGFRELDRRFESILDLSEAPDAAPEPSEGVTIVSLAERPDLVAAAYDVEREAVPDIPTPVPLQVAPFEKWLARMFEGPGSLPEGSFVALADGEAVGYAGLKARDGEPGTADHLMTAVRRAWRGRGVASALKQAQIAWARQAGFEQLVASNDAGNVAMRGINARLGYRPENVEIVVRGPVA